MAEGGACLVDTHFLENGLTEYGHSNRKHLDGVGKYSAVLQKYKRRKIPAIRTFPKGCGRNAPILSELPNSSAEPKSVSELKPSLLMPIQAPNTDDLVCCGNSRKISAVRKFPFGCGRNARELTAEERRNYLASLTKKVADDSRPSLVEARCQELVEYRPSDKEHVSRKALAQSASLTKFIPRKKVTLMSKSFSHSAKLAQPVVSKILDTYEAETNGLDYVCHKEIILALMAAPNCPWMTGKSVSVLNEIATSDNSFNVFDGNSDLGDDDILPISTAYPEAEGGDMCLELMPFVMNPPKNKSARLKVRETLRLFQAVVRKLQQEAARFEERNPAFRRIDFQASNALKEKNKWVNTGKPIVGHVPGVEVGDEFHYRIELCIIGLHRPNQAGIDYTKDSDGTTVTTSIVASTSHDDLESPEVLVYTGQGGLDPKKKPEDQKLEKGNLGLKNCIKKMTPVRVIRGFKETKNDARGSSKAKDVSTYTYDGFYRVEKYWEERSSLHGCLVYKFLLRRLPGQPELAWKIVKQSKKSKSRPGVCVEDISKGKEKLPIPVVNTVDNERPPPFEYITKIKYPTGYKHTLPRGCDCENECSDFAKCLCAFKNGGEIPFNFDGAIVEAKPLVYGCGPACKCSQSCPNRVGQHGIKIPLEIFKTESRGWGVRALTSISSGSFICEYFGEVLRDMEADQLSNDEYLFDIGHNYHDQSLWEGLSTLIPDLQIPASSKVVEEGLYAIDAARYGNVGRFINHSCSPNLYAQNVLYDHDDKTLPHIMFFAAENIPPLQELTYHYNYIIDQVRDSNGNIRRKDCYCGSDECSGRLY